MPELANIVARDQKKICLWLACCALLIGAMVVAGGYTRLSGSGLSITQWKPLHGFIPPLGQAEWEEEFAGYRQIPQYVRINAHMTLEEFKSIFWPEYWHRVLGRIIGIAFLIPFLIFLKRGSIRGKLVIQLIGIFALGALQGCIGWYMVSSGLSELTHVSHLRLMLHLGMAFLILALIIRIILALSLPRIGTALPGSIVPCFSFLCILIYAQILMGAMLAGLHGGLIYNSFPTMDGQWMHADVFNSYESWFNNIAFIQFAHRWLAMVLGLGILGGAIYYRCWLFKPPFILFSIGLITAVILQITLGVFTLLYQTPLPLALLHQSGGLLLFCCAIALLYRLRST